MGLFSCCGGPSKASRKDIQNAFEVSSKSPQARKPLATGAIFQSPKPAPPKSSEASIVVDLQSILMSIESNPNQPLTEIQTLLQRMVPRLKETGPIEGSRHLLYAHLFVHAIGTTTIMVAWCIDAIPVFIYPSLRPGNVVINQHGPFDSLRAAGFAAADDPGICVIRGPSPSTFKFVLPPPPPQPMPGALPYLESLSPSVRSRREMLSTILRMSPFLSADLAAAGEVSLMEGHPTLQLFHYKSNAIDAHVWENTGSSTVGLLTRLRGRGIFPVFSGGASSQLEESPGSDWPWRARFLLAPGERCMFGFIPCGPRFSHRSTSSLVIGPTLLSVGYTHPPVPPPPRPNVQWAEELKAVKRILSVRSHPRNIIPAQPIFFPDNPLPAIETVCRKYDVQFEDHQFPAVDSSLVIMGDEHPRLTAIKKNVEWLRPDYFLCDPRAEQRRGSPDSVDNCEFEGWSASVLAVCSQQRDLLARLISPPSRHGAYAVRMFVNHRWVFLVVDDRIPIHGTDVCFSRHVDRNVVWPMVLEKALAKWAGAYGQLFKSSSLRSPVDAHMALTALTGCDRLIRMPMADGGKHSGVIVAREFIARNELANTGGSDTFLALVRARDDPRLTRVGLMPDHTYAVHLVAQVDGDEVSGGYMLRLRSPGRETRWLGPWASGSDYWTKFPDVHTRFSPQMHGEGVFHISVADLAHYFAEFCVCGPARMFHSMTGFEHAVSSPIFDIASYVWNKTSGNPPDEKLVLDAAQRYMGAVRKYVIRSSIEPAEFSIAPTEDSCLPQRSYHKERGTYSVHRLMYYRLGFVYVFESRSPETLRFTNRVSQLDGACLMPDLSRGDAVEQVGVFQVHSMTIPPMSCGVFLVLNHAPRVLGDFSFKWDCISQTAGATISKRSATQGYGSAAASAREALSPTAGYGSPGKKNRARPGSRMFTRVGE
eukprot:gnl/Dysnectes_brevis/3077_a3823_622.p1 GENE.gnl/Dysnectes_brevis/3077_a3823_622~~gnl/Dysnectes_brevis/3077_a3823_622.p1  ORF type:complete len:934 (-),score=316.38 gnl/Dysnectes_brevis/3077_a3823_622:97-2898(-)